MGGTFDPIHHGHLFIAEAARVELSLERVIWVPTGDPPHKEGPHRASQEHRCAMTRLAAAGNAAFEVSRLELDREGPSYSLYTVEHFQREHPGAELYFIAGADSILELPTWHRHADLVRAARFVAAPRPGFDLSRMAAVLPPDYLGRIYVLQAPEIYISSSDLRRRVAAGQPVRYLVPDAVDTYIREHRLYLTGPAGRQNPG
jgi:nicotinate-nucleotide adenylyltransferase